MPSKITLICQQATYYTSGNETSVGRAAGFSESWYSDSDASSAGLPLDIDELCKARAGLLPNSAAIVAQRIQRVDARGIPGQAQLIERYYGGRYGTNDGALPNKALCFYTKAANLPNHKMTILRGTPDSVVVQGEYKRTNAFQAALTAFFTELRDHWKFQARVRTNTSFKLVSVGAGGAFETEDNHGLANGDYVRLLRCYTNEKNSVTGVFRVSGVAAKTGTLDRYAADVGLVVARGKIRKDEIHYPAIRIDEQELRNPDAITRQVGLPFRRFRGRRSAKS